ncbi:MAG: pyruvate formate-lyase 1-activating enzyme [Firmicutes bacterium HGW-Firmicutes-2]|nr:MAG: pyruvate formate-lyase 1-activating enzyme [Firmicutes bacterium HGW-Firmicutes-2]
MKHGKIHSIESCGTVDGPGIRFVLFLQGCPLRCQYCHNPDTWKIGDGTDMTVESLMKEIVKYKSFMRFSNGGVTLTGGEPLLQVEFVYELIMACKREGIHTAIDTSGYIFNDYAKKVIDEVDLVLLDVKHSDPKQYEFITGAKLQPTLDFLNYLGELGKPVWIRYVLVPGLTDQPEAIEALALHLSQYNNIEKIEILPFHKMGEYKWAQLGETYRLKDFDEPTKIQMIEAMAILKKHNLNVVTT